MRVIFQKEDVLILAENIYCKDSLAVRYCIEDMAVALSVLRVDSANP